VPLETGGRLGVYQIVSAIGAGGMGEVYRARDTNDDVSPDSRRFVMVKDDSSSGSLNVVLNWFEELKRLAWAR